MESQKIHSEALRIFREHLKEKKVTFAGRGVPAGLMKAWAELESTERIAYWLEAAGATSKGNARAMTANTLENYFPAHEDVESPLAEPYVPTEEEMSVEQEDVEERVGNSRGKEQLNLSEEDLEWLNNPEVFASLSEPPPDTVVGEPSSRLSDVSLSEEDIAWLNSPGIAASVLSLEMDALARVPAEVRTLLDKYGDERSSERGNDPHSNASQQRDSSRRESRKNLSVQGSGFKRTAVNSVDIHARLQSAAASSATITSGHSLGQTKKEDLTKSNEAPDPFMERACGQPKGKARNNVQISMKLKELEDGIPDKDKIIKLAKQYPTGNPLLKDPEQLKPIQNGFQIKTLDESVKINVYRRTVVLAGSEPHRGIKLIEQWAYPGEPAGKRRKR